ncbi:zincin-like metallopeptidase domain-containing protein [Sphingobium sp. DEHP117]|nr:zincin-like metallopeptidase domain-containing protein [Sphingobium sp. DEHP117]MDQ4420199.1 zincin-like metallopeptidase domain-containing protein [Sphingobium sp. DEHP117]
MVFFLEPRIGAGLSGYVAEIASAFCCAALGIAPTVRHADYIGSWLALCSPRHNLANREVSIM